MGQAGSAASSMRRWLPSVVPANARFQVVSEHDADNFLFDAGYLGIDRSDDLVIIQITWNEGRTVDQKKALYKAIVDGLAKAPGIRPEDVFINLVDVRKENWSVGKGRNGWSAEWREPRKIHYTKY
jgi:phenylpyruvate tautomerase PptA (4-oxalocrotonate tautomerase family)